ncbi:hypothetical protein ACWDE9_14595 [Streptomyces olivaceoviridis]
MARDNRGKSAELLTVRQVLDELGGVSRRTFYRGRELRASLRPASERADGPAVPRSAA